MTMPRRPQPVDDLDVRVGRKHVAVHRPLV